MAKTHILRIHVLPPLQLTINLWNPITPNKFHIWQNAYILRIHVPPCNTPIDNRFMEYHYTKSVLHIPECTYTENTSNSLPQLTIDLWNTITPNNFHIKQNTHILRINLPLTPTPPIHNRSVEYLYTK